MKDKITNKNSFTLIELLVSISIIIMIISTSSVIYGKAVAKARDAQRLADMERIVEALRAYYADHGYYPDPKPGTPQTGQAYSDRDCSAGAGCWDKSSTDIDGDGTYFLDPLA